MDSRFAPHNTHLEDPALFVERDPQLRLLKHQVYVFHSSLIKQFPFNVPGIYTLGGGRQIGKTTLLKQWMLELLNRGIPKECIAFITGEIIDDQHALFNILQIQLESMPKNKILYIILDEVTYIKDWDKTIKYFADAGLLENVILMLTGSDLFLIQEARMRFPGRRGQADIVNFHLYPLSFKEVVFLKNRIPDLKNILNQNITFTDGQVEILFEDFQYYLQHGGYLTAINDIAKNQIITKATLITYSEWIRGDMLKRGKQEHYLREILSALIKRYNSQITWNSLAQDLSIDHPKTVADYINLLESMDALFVQAALIEDKLVAAPKKGKKIIFTDPFIFHATREWLEPVQDPYHSQILPAINNDGLCSKLVEACVTSHFRRFYPTYYIKAEGEVDIAYIKQKRFWPIEIKWTNQLRPKDLKQILKYSNGQIFSKVKTSGNIQTIPIKPLPIALLSLAE